VLKDIIMSKGQAPITTITVALSQAFASRLASRGADALLDMVVFCITIRSD
jgi:hypothetical protein